MDLMEKIVALAKRRGFVYPTSEIYGGLANSYDYGPAGAELLRNIRNTWWAYFINGRDDMVGIDTQILLHPKTWEASGHVSSFNEPRVTDLKTNKTYRADHLIENWLPEGSDIVVEEMNAEEMDKFIKDNHIKSPEGNEVSEIKKFNQLFETAIGSVVDEKNKVYLRGETAQGIFTDFKQVLDSSRVKLPFGIGQIGKSFRNEITTGQFIFRTLELEQAEIEYFFDPESSDWNNLFENWKEAMMDFVTKAMGIKSENLRWRRHTDKERSHYSKETYDLDYKFPFGWKELWGIAYRTDYDLKQHMQFSGQSLEYTDLTGKKFLPHVIEPAVGLGRLFLMALVDAYSEDSSAGSEQVRVVLKLNPKIAPYKVAVFPLLANKEDLVNKAREVYELIKIKSGIPAIWDDRGNIGKRYFAQDEIGTPWCVTVDFDTLEDETVTVRDRDTARQDRIEISALQDYFTGKLK